MYTSFSVLCQPPPQKKCQNFQIPVIFRIFRQLFLPLTLHGFHQTHAALIFIFYIDVLRGKTFLFYLHENVLDPKFINRVTSHQKHQWKEILELPQKM